MRMGASDHNLAVSASDRINQRHELILKILSCVRSVHGKVKFVKMLHFVCKMLEENHKLPPFVFGSGKFGVYSVEIEPVLRSLEQQGYIQTSIDSESKRQSILLLREPSEFKDHDIKEMGTKIESITQRLGDYDYMELVSMSYEMFPKTTTRSMIKPEINKTIDELKPYSDDEYGINSTNQSVTTSATTTPLYPRFNDLDIRVAMMESIGIDALPTIIPDSIDQSAGIITNSSLLKKYDFEELLKNARR